MRSLPPLQIPKEEIVNIEIPTGLPLVFDMRHKCLKLLEGDFTTYNFGKGAELLFTPCEIPDEDYEELDLSPVIVPSSTTPDEEQAAEAPGDAQEATQEAQGAKATAS